MYTVYIIFRVCDFIKYGWDIFLIDPDGGANVQQKLQANAIQSDADLLQSIPKPTDKLWSKQIYKVPKVTFGTIYDFLVERKVLAQKANPLMTLLKKETVRHFVVQILINQVQVLVIQLCIPALWVKPSTFF